MSTEGGKNAAVTLNLTTVKSLLSFQSLRHLVIFTKVITSPYNLKHEQTLDLDMQKGNQAENRGNYQATHH